MPKFVGANMRISNAQLQNLSLHDHLCGVGVSGRNLRKKAFIDAMFCSLELRTLQLPTRHSNDRRHYVCIAHVFSPCFMAETCYIHTAWAFVARSLVRASSKASVMELATMRVPRFFMPKGLMSVNSGE